MKTLYQILTLALLTLSSCSSTLYRGAEYDDLYYLPSDKPIAQDKSSVNQQITEGNLKGNDYYNNIYAADTLVSDQYSDAVDYDAQVNNNDYNNNQGYEYFNDNSYTGRLRMFYGNYFNPYWREPYYSDYGYGGYPYSYGFGNSFYGNNPYYGYGGGFYNDYYGGYYPGYYGGGYYGGGYGGGFYGGGFYGGGYYGGYNSFYSPYYGYPGNYFHNGGENSVPSGRRERSSTLSSRMNNNVSPTSTSRRDSYVSGGSSSVAGRTSGNQTLSGDQRRAVSSNGNSQQSVNQTTRRSGQDQTKTEYIRSNTASPRASANTRPDYNSTNRSYTPSYNNPRMSTRPSYNNSRVSEGVNSGVNRNSSSPNNSRVYNNAGSVRTPSNQGSYQNSYNNVRSNSSGNGVQRRSESPSGYSAPANQSRSNSNRSSESYSVPSRSSVERSGTSSGSSGNSSRSSSTYSGGSESRGSYSSGSSSSGSSSSGSSSSGSRSGGSSSGRR